MYSSSGASGIDRSLSMLIGKEPWDGHTRFFLGRVVRGQRSPQLRQLVRALLATGRSARSGRSRDRTATPCQADRSRSASSREPAPTATRHCARRAPRAAPLPPRQPQRASGRRHPWCGRLGSAAPPAAAAVAKRSKWCTGSRTVDPAAMRAGHFTKYGTWIPPSKSVIFQPRNGSFTSGRPMYPAPPLSEVNITRVFSSRPLARSASRTCPTPRSSASDHGGVDPLAMQFDVGECLVVFLRRLQRGVRRPVREIQEEGPILVRLDDLDGLLRVVVGEVAARLERLAAVEGRGEAQGAPQEAIDGVEVLLGVDHVRESSSGRYSPLAINKLSSKPWSWGAMPFVRPRCHFPMCAVWYPCRLQQLRQG